MSHPVPHTFANGGIGVGGAESQPSGVMGALKQKVKDFFLKIDNDWSDISSESGDEEEKGPSNQHKGATYNTVYSNVLGYPASTARSSVQGNLYKGNSPIQGPGTTVGTSVPRKTSDFVSRIMSREISSIYPNSPSFQARMADATAAYSTVPPISYQRRSSIALTK